MNSDRSRLPVLFLAHGSPMNAIIDNAFTRTLTELGKSLPRPRAILMISAHWMTRGKTAVTHMARPKTIHDFRGFPKELFAVQYPAPGSPATAEEIRDLIGDPKIELDDDSWGLDHGAWAVLKFVYPKADVPVVQLSLDLTKDTGFHFSLGEKLRVLRDRGVLIIGSGNIVHNLRAIDWNENARAFDWASEFDLWVKRRIDSRDFAALVKNYNDSEAGKMSVPTVEHYLPLLYVLGASTAEDRIDYVFEEIHHGSIAMRCVIELAHPASAQLSLSRS